MRLNQLNQQNNPEFDTPQNKEKAHRWFAQPQKSNEIILSSRIRLARNIDDVPFPQWASDKQLRKVGEIVRESISSSNYLSMLRFYQLDELSNLEKQTLIEEHAISPHFIENSNTSFLAISNEHEVSIMVNEEDHIRLQILSIGGKLDETWEIINKFDDEFGKAIKFAFSEKWGYLTACPSNVGTAIRVSQMLHLPALVMTQQLQALLLTVAQVGVTVRGLFGEGTHSVGNFFQISNSMTLGKSETEVIEHIKNIGQQIADKEKSARKILYSQKRDKLADSSHRALGILKYAKLMSFEEAMELLSMLRLGMDLKLIESIDVVKLNELLIQIRPAHLSTQSGESLSQRDEERARTDLIRKTLIKEE